MFILGLCINGETRLFLATSGYVCLGASAGQNPVTRPHVLLKGVVPFGCLTLLQRARGRQKETKYQHSSGRNLGFLVTS